MEALHIAFLVAPNTPHAPIDDAFLKPLLIVKPTGSPWNAAANRQALRILEVFHRQSQPAFRRHLRIKDDKDVTPTDFEIYHVVLFGDPGSNFWIAKLDGPHGESLSTERDRFFCTGNRNPLNPSRYVVLNSGLTANWEDWAGDFSGPQYGDCAILRVGEREKSPTWRRLASSTRPGTFLPARRL